MSPSIRAATPLRALLPGLTFRMPPQSSRAQPPPPSPGRRMSRMDAQSRRHLRRKKCCIRKECRQAASQYGKNLYRRKRERTRTGSFFLCNSTAGKSKCARSLPRSARHGQREFSIGRPAGRPLAFHFAPVQSGIGTDGVSFRASAAFAAGDEGIDPEGGIAHGNMEG